MRKSLVLSIVFLIVVPVLAKDDAKIKMAVAERYQQWIAAENKKDAQAITDLYDENAVLMPKEEEPVIGWRPSANTTKSSSPTRTLCRSR